MPRNGLEYVDHPHLNVPSTIRIVIGANRRRPGLPHTARVGGTS